MISSNEQRATNNTTNHQRSMLVGDTNPLVTRNSVLRNYIDSHLPSFIITVHSVGNVEKRDYYVHSSATNHSTRLREVYARRRNGDTSASLLDATTTSTDSDDASNNEPETKRARAGVSGAQSNKQQQFYTGDLVQIIDFHMDWVPAYADLCPNDFTPFSWFIEHLCAFEDIGPEKWQQMSRNKSLSRRCPVASVMNANSLTYASCTHARADQSDTALAYVVLVSLLHWFECPTVIVRHLVAALIYHVRHSELSYFFLPYILPDTTTCHQRLVIGMLQQATRSLLFTVEPVDNETDRQLPHLLQPTRSLHAGLQTIGTVHKFEDFHGVRQFDVADFFHGYRCEFFIASMPLLLFAETELVDMFPCRTVCTCTNVTEARLSLKRVENPTRYCFEFAALRDLRTVDRLFQSIGDENECLRLRSHDGTSLNVMWNVDTREEVLRITVEYVTSNSRRGQPAIIVDIAVLNAMTVETQHALHLNPNTVHPQWIEPLSDAVRLFNECPRNERQHHRRASANDLAIHHDVVTRHNQRLIKMTHTWIVDFQALRRGDGTRGWPEYDYGVPLPSPFIASSPPRLFMIRGSVHFDVE